MSLDPRIVLRNAAGGEAPPSDGATMAMRRGIRLRWHRRAGVVVSAAIVLAMAGALIGASPGIPHKEIAPVGPVGSGGPRSREAPRVPARTEVTPSAPPRPTDGGQGIAEMPDSPTASRLPNVVEPTRACVPPVQDHVADIEGGSRDYDTVDIVSTTFSFDPQDETLRFVHKMKDIAREDTREHSTWFDVQFAWDGIIYLVDVWIEGGVDHFSVQRRSRSPSASGPMESSVVTVANGEIDEVDDTVGVSFTLPAFNSGERALSASEGQDRPKELRAGSSIDLLNLSTLGQLITSPTPATRQSDSLRLGCSFTLEG